jgi:hypothetical protein
VSGKGEESRGLDFNLAYSRVKDELRSRTKTARALAHNPFELELIDLDLEAWIADLEARVRDDNYVPGPLDVCDYPKGSNLVRPASRLGIADRVVITAAVGACIDMLDEATRWSQGSCDFAARLDPAKLHEREWFRNPFKGWKEFHDRSLQRLGSPTYKYVLTADIAGFFENINIGLLRSDLKRIKCPSQVVGLIGACLNQWAQCPDRGLPQGVLASDLLAKLYLEPFDQRLRAASLVHLRYSDDLRIFTRTEEEAQRALVAVTRILRERGLTLQSSKTRIRSAEDAHEEFDGIMPAIERVRRGYIDEVIASGLMSSDVSLPMTAIDDLAGDAQIDPVVLHRSFESYVVKQQQPNKSMLNFLLRRLGKQGDDFAVEECGRRLTSNPEHTPSIALYFQDLERPEELEPNIVAALLHETSAIYPYQRYLLLDWLARNAASLREPTLDIVRELAVRPESPLYVQAVAFQLLGSFGGHSDLDEIEARFKRTSDSLRRAQLLSCLGRLEKGRRNGLAARVAKEPGWVGRAVEMVRRGAAVPANGVAA